MDILTSASRDQYLSERTENDRFTTAAPNDDANIRASSGKTGNIVALLERRLNLVVTHSARDHRSTVWPQNMLQVDNQSAPPLIIRVASV